MRSGRALDERFERTQERRNLGAAQPVIFHSQHAQVATPLTGLGLTDSRR